MTPPEPVTYAELLRRPLSLHERRIVVTGLWVDGFEHSAFAGAWLTPPPSWRGAADDGAREYVRVTGTWRARGRTEYGHFGMWPAELAAETTERLPLETSVVVGPGELAAGISRFVGQLVEARVTACVGHEHSSVDGVVLDWPLRRDVRDPVEAPARALVWVEGEEELAVLEWAWTQEPRPTRVRLVPEGELTRHRGEIVEVVGALRAGEYWPVMGLDYDPVEVVPPEITTSARAHLAFGRAEPPPPELLAWRERLARGPLPVRVRGTMRRQHLSAYALEVLDRPLSG